MRYAASMLSALFMREWRLLCVARAQLLTLAAYPLLLLLVGALALDLPQQGGSVRVALLLIAFILTPLVLTGMAWERDLRSGALIQLRCHLLAAVWARYAVTFLGILLPVTLLLLALAGLLLNIALPPLLLPLLLALPSLTGLLLLVAALMPVQNNGSLAALLLLPLLVPVIVLLTLAVTAPAGLAQAALWWLGALAALSLGLLPPAIATALRQKLAS